MCGIAGVYIASADSADGVASTNGRQADAEAALRLMLGRLQHRGPDDLGSLHSSGGGACVALGHTRLAIIDLSPAGHQPMRTADGLQITFNGEIYNFNQLRERLGTADGLWSSRSDTEVILRAYARWGADAFKRLRGMFAFAIWDERSERLVLARDPFGIKPLYYFHDGARFVFASEVRALLSSGLVPKEICPEGLASYLSYGAVEAPLSIIKGVRVLMPGHCLTVSRRGGGLDLDERPYADDVNGPGGDAAPANLRDAAVRLREVLEDSLRHHLVSDVPVGAFLSGGIDSSAIVALMSRVTDERPRTFSVVFDEKDFTEAEYALLVSRKFRTEHHEVTLSEGELLSLLPRALSDMDHPTIDGINTYVVAKAVSGAGIKVALSGLGGDELFAGYPSFRRALLMKRLSVVPRGVRRATARVGRALLNSSVQQRKAWDLLGGDPSPAYAYSTSRQLFSPREVAELTGARVRGNGHAPDAARPGGGGEEDFVNAVSRCEMNGYMTHMLLRDTDHMSMAHSLEVRVPFIDTEVVSYVMSLPGSWKVDSRRPKPLLLEALGDLLPEQIWRRRKMGFTLPFERWMGSELSRDVDDTLRTGVVFGDAAGQAVARRVWDDFRRSPRRERWSRSWALYVLSRWCELNGVCA